MKRHVRNLKFKINPYFAVLCLLAGFRSLSSITENTSFRLVVVVVVVAVVVVVVELLCYCCFGIVVVVVVLFVVVVALLFSFI